MYKNLKDIGYQSINDALEDQLIQYYLRVCLSYLSFAVISLYDQGNLQMKVFNLDLQMAELEIVISFSMKNYVGHKDPLGFKMAETSRLR